MNLIAAALAVAGGLLGLGQWVRFRTGRERQAAIGQGFTAMIAGLGSESTVQRLASAALLRRFFDKGSEFGAGGLPYAKDAIKVAAGVLRLEPEGPVQKLLADGVASAPSLAGADFQRVNLRGCYWGTGARGSRVDASRADFFGADLTGASLRGANLRGAIFREAHLARAVFIDADLTGANFTGADLRGTKFQGAFLHGARFVGARHVPDVISSGLDATGQYSRAEPVPREATSQLPAERLSVFLSAPSVVEDSDRILLAMVERGLAQANVELVRFLPHEYGLVPPLEEVTRRIAGSHGVVVLGTPQLRARGASFRLGTGDEQTGLTLALPTPWNQVEAGIAAGLDRPILIIGSEVRGGVFDLDDQPGAVARLTIETAEQLASLDTRIREWASQLPAVAAQP
jgi:hypothetical protein